MLLTQLEAYKNEINSRQTINRDDVIALESLVNDKFITNTIALEQFSKTRTTLFKSEVLERLDELINKEKSININLSIAHKLKDMENYYDNLYYKVLKHLDKESLKYYANFQYLEPKEDGSYQPLIDFTPFENILKNKEMIHCEDVLKRYEFHIANYIGNKEFISNVIYIAHAYGDNVEENLQPTYTIIHSKNTDLQDIKFLYNNLDTIMSGLKNIVDAIKSLRLRMLDVNRSEKDIMKDYSIYNRFVDDYDRCKKPDIFHLFLR